MRTIFLIGGWGCPNEWISPLSEALQQSGDVSVISISLPGYSSSLMADNGPLDYDVIVSEWLDATAKEMVKSRSFSIVGWSYGGMLALTLAEYIRQHYEGMGNIPVITLGSRPCFINDEFTVFDTSAAHSFLNRVKASGGKGVSYFIALVAGQERREVIRFLKQEAVRTPINDQVLIASLEHLFSLDVSDVWFSKASSGYLYSVYFEQDALIKFPEGVSESQRLSHGHLAPLIQPKLVAETILSWLNTKLLDTRNKAETIE